MIEFSGSSLSLVEISLPEWCLAEVLISPLKGKGEDVADEAPLHEDNEWGITLEDEFVPQDTTQQRQVAEGITVRISLYLISLVH